MKRRAFNTMATTIVAVPLLGVLLALPGCGDDAQADVGDVDGVTEEVGGPDGEVADEGGAGAPCEMDFDCAVGQACRDGSCAATSPDGWCPKIFDRPLRRRILGGALSAPISHCGPRCLMGSGRLVEDDPSTLVQVVRQRGEAGVVDTTYPPGPDHALWDKAHLALFEEADGSVLSATYDQWGNLIVERFADGVVETPALFPTTDLGMPYGEFADVRGRFQRDGDGVLHLFLTTAQDFVGCVGHVVQNAGAFQLLAVDCLTDPGPELVYGPADAMVRTDGAIDVVGELGPSDSTLFDQYAAFWLDGLDPAGAEPLPLGPGLGPQLCLAPDGSSVLGLDVWIAGPEWPLPDRKDLLWLGPAGSTERSLPLRIDHVRSAGFGREGLLSCDPAETVVLIRGGWSGEPEPLALWRDGTVLAQEDLMAAVKHAGGAGAIRWEHAWYERCGGFRALLVELVETSVTQSSYVEW
jgi:YD repeat-containing protein